MVIKEKIEQNVEELHQIAISLDEEQLKKAAQACMECKRIFFSGMGRSGNMVKALAIRFMHLGYEAYVAGDASTPSIGAGDLLFAVSSSAKTKVTLNHIEVAKNNSARVLLLTSLVDNPQIADYFLCIPAKTNVSSKQHAGSLFEQSVLVVGDAISAYIQEEKSVTAEFMNKRHANLQ